jgi:hypothetical protein
VFELFLVHLYLLLYLVHDVLDLPKVGLLGNEHVSYLLGALSVLLVIVLESIHDVQILECNQRILEDLKVEELVLFKVIVHDLVREGSEHQH